MSFNPLSAYKAELQIAEFNRISEFINQNFGIKLPDHKRIMLQGRLLNRLVKLNFDNFKEYTDYVFSEHGKIQEQQHMIDAISTNKTDFFRESVHFDYLRETVFPEIIEKKLIKPINIWSTACSSGEEAYTIAMVAQDYFGKFSKYDFNILATDISIRMLEKAKTAIYPIQLTMPIPLETKKKYLLKSKDPNKAEVRIIKMLRDKISFEWHNLIDKEYKFQREFDIIFCRNVLIYFSKKDQLHVLNNLTKKLKSGGYLFLGHSESIAQFDLPLQSVSQTVYKKI
jgi:chemotaxis protein methyltransferase CheR